MTKKLLLLIVTLALLCGCSGNIIKKPHNRADFKTNDLIRNFRDQTGINAIKSIDTTILIAAMKWQGSGDYSGIDDWVVVEIPDGTKVLGGLPGQSEFYSVYQTLVDAKNNRAKYWQSLQVKAHVAFGYRIKVREYILNQTTKVGISKTLANPQFGIGGAWQIFIIDFSVKLRPEKEIALDQ